MSIRTLIELGEFLDSELSWRKKELTTLRFLVRRTRRHEVNALLRAAICMLYAHWEGFVKAAATGYVCYVNTRRLKYRELSPNFVALARIHRWTGMDGVRAAEGGEGVTGAMIRGLEFG